MSPIEQAAYTEVQQVDGEWCDFSAPKEGFFRFDPTARRLEEVGGTTKCRNSPFLLALVMVVLSPLISHASTCSFAGRLAAETPPFPD
jgi:hypothetical protein